MTIFKPVYVFDIIGEVVTATAAAIVSKNPNKTLLQTIQENEAAALGATLIEGIRYSKSSFAELIATLIQDDKPEETRNTKYPLIHLVRDFWEDRGKIIGFYAEVALNIIFVHQTVNTYKIGDREANVFKPILYPIYYEFFNQLAKHPQITVESNVMISHRKWDRPYWGNGNAGSSKNKLTDFVDAIECQNILLKINFKNC